MDSTDLGANSTSDDPRGAEGHGLLAAGSLSLLLLPLNNSASQATAKTPVSHGRASQHCPAGTAEHTRLELSDGGVDSIVCPLLATPHPSGTMGG